MGVRAVYTLHSFEYYFMNKYCSGDFNTVHVNNNNNKLLQHRLRQQ